MKNKYKILISILFILYFSTKLPVVQDIVKNIKSAYDDKLTYKLHNELSDLNKEDTIQVIESYVIKHKESMLTDKTILSVKKEGLKFIISIRVNYRELLLLDNIKSDNSKLSSILKSTTTDEICRQSINNLLIIKKFMVYEKNYYNNSNELKDKIIIDKNACIEWNKNNYSYIFTKRIISFTQKLKSD